MKSNNTSSRRVFITKVYAAMLPHSQKGNLYLTTAKAVRHEGKCFAIAVIGQVGVRETTVRTTFAPKMVGRATLKPKMGVLGRSMAKPKPGHPRLTFTEWC